MAQRDWKSTDFLIATIAMQFIVCVTVFLDIPVARQVFGFLYLTFIPGIILVRILKLRRLDLGEILLLSVGLSVAFLIFLGLLINELSPLTGISKPLTMGSLMVTANVVLLLMVFLSCLVNKEDSSAVAVNSLRLSPLVIPLILLPLISVAGTVLVNTSQNNVLLLLMIIAISLLIPLSALSKRLLHPRFYALALLMIGIALLFHSSLISNYIYGNDIHAEYHLFKLTRDKSNWDSKGPYSDPRYAKLNAMLSITVLPTIFSTILNMSETWVLKIVYPLIFSFISLGLYKFYSIKFDKKAAFLATFFFLANFSFFTDMLGLARQMIAELFYVLLFFVLFSKKMDSLSKKICFIIFGGALVVSHYAVSYIFMFFIISTWLILFLLKKKPGKITINLIVLYLILSFSWYIYVSRSEAFNAIVTMGNNVFTNLLTDFFTPESRGEEVLMGLGIAGSPSFWHWIGRIVAYVTEFLIILGFITLLTKRKKMPFDQEYLILLTLNLAMIAMSIVVPNLAESFRMTRLYHLLLITLAPLCIIGARALFAFIFSLGRRKTKPNSLAFILIVLTTFFLFQTELVYEVVGDVSTSIPLSNQRMIESGYLGVYFYGGFFDEHDVFGATWLSENLDGNHTLIYADRNCRMQVLASYGMIHLERTELLSNSTEVVANGTVYLRRVNVVYGIIEGRGPVFNVTEITFILNNMSKVYSNGGCEIYKDSKG